MKFEPALVKDTRARILEAALELFAEHGYAGTSVRRLARAVGLRESSLYNHFAGKEAIYHALIDAHGPASSADRLRGPRYAAVKNDPAAFCRLYVEDLLDQWSDPREQRFQELILAERNRFEGERAHYVEALFSDELGMVTRFFSGFALGEPIAAPQPSETARLFMAGLTFIRLEHYIMPAKASARARVRAALDRFLDTFLALIAAPQLGDAHGPPAARRS
ncbi:TetR/AcrR family transcriptional regulator [Phenylobacterium sp.]|uniref:TetR/AcrR family transcriptional regulator n=1 Tax=Phenylobacterium sp. TaxID=1871053 RepID=UPI002FC9A6E9